MILLICGAVLYSSLVTAVGFFILRQREPPVPRPSEQLAPPEKVEPSAPLHTSATLPTSTEQAADSLVAERPTGGDTIARLMEDVSAPNSVRSAVNAHGERPPTEVDSVVERPVAATRHRHPLMIEVNKDAYDKHIEIRAALKSMDFEEAARLIVSLSGEQWRGVIPDPQDPEVFISSVKALEMLRHEHPALQETIRQRHLPQGWVRARSAMQSHDDEALAGITFQFAGTEVAAEAYQWLGDQALSRGDFSLAESYYDNGLRSSTEEPRTGIEARSILANALSRIEEPAEIRRRVSALPNLTLRLNGTDVSKPQFVAMIEDLVSRSNATELLVDTNRVQQAVFPKSTIRLEKRSEFDGPAGHDPGRWDYRVGDPFGRQIAVQADEKRIYISNRFHVQAYSNVTGESLWSRIFPGEQGDAYAMAFTPTKPILNGDRLFVRHLKRSGAHLACLKSESGDVIWDRLWGEGVLSDPHIWGGRLFAMLLSKREDDQHSVDAAWIDPSTGEITQTISLFGLSDSNEEAYSAQIAIQGRRAILAVGGCTACIDWQGGLIWVRQHRLDEQPVNEPIDFRSSLPIVDGDHVIVTQPRVAAICCLDLATGRIVWQRPIVRLRGLLGRSESNVIADTSMGIVAIDSTTGKVAWQDDFHERLEGFTIEDQSLIVAVREPVNENNSRPAIIRIDFKTGAVKESTYPEVTPRREFQLGPLFSSSDKWWCLVGESWNDQRRELCELIGTSEPIN